MGRRLQYISAALLAIGAPAQIALADALGNDYAELSYVFEQFDFGDDTIEGDGFGLRTSKEIFSRFQFIGEYQQQEFADVNFVDVRQQRMALGLAYRHDFSWRLDAYAQVSIDAIRTDLEQSTEEDIGIGDEVGVRMIPFDNVDELQLEGFLDYTRLVNPLNNTESSVSGGVRARWHFNDNLSIGGGVQIGDGSLQGFATIRLEFDGVRFGR